MKNTKVQTICQKPFSCSANSFCRGISFFHTWNLQIIVAIDIRKGVRNMLIFCIDASVCVCVWASSCTKYHSSNINTWNKTADLAALNKVDSSFWGKTS